MLSIVLPKIFGNKVLQWLSEIYEDGDRIFLVGISAFYERCAGELEEVKSRNDNHSFPR
jgi:hypothetical protein